MALLLKIVLSVLVLAFVFRKYLMVGNSRETLLNLALEY